MSASLSTKRRCFQNNPLHEGSPSPSSRCLLSSGTGSSTNSSNTLRAPGMESIDKSSSSPACAKSASPATHQCPRKPTRKGRASRGPPSSGRFPARGNQPINFSSLQLLRTWSLVLWMTACSVALSSLYPREAGMVLTNGGSKPRVKGATTRGGPNEVAVARASYSSPTESPPPGVPVLWVGWVGR